MMKETAPEEGARDLVNKLSNTLKKAKKTVMPMTTTMKMTVKKKTPLAQKKNPKKNLLLQ